LRRVVLRGLNDSGIVIEEDAEGGADGGTLAKAIGQADAGLPVVIYVVIELASWIDFNVRGQHPARDAGRLLELFTGARLLLDDVDAALQVVAAGEDVLVAFLAERRDEGLVVPEAEVDREILRELPLILEVEGHVAAAANGGGPVPESGGIRNVQQEAGQLAARGSRVERIRRLQRTERSAGVPGRTQEVHVVPLSAHFQLMVTLDLGERTLVLPNIGRPIEGDAFGTADPAVDV
jgi:hypothetical protein